MANPLTMKDRIGRDIKPGDPVVFRHKRWKMLQTGRIKHLTKKQARVVWVDRGFEHDQLAGTVDIILLPEEDYALYILTTA
jgi:hypothetical protein